MSNIFKIAMGFVLLIGVYAGIETMKPIREFDLKLDEEDLII